MGKTKDIPTTPLGSTGPNGEKHSRDRRRVFVVFGRNKTARDALFDFLRALDLKPIEWEEAIAWTKHGAPFIGQALDSAFESAQAAVVLITGDDMARAGKRYLLDHDPVDERNLTPQARPNVIFEAGMAFGIFPDRTIVVTLDSSRQFSDIAGRHAIHLSDKIDSRQELRDRLETAGCAVETFGKTDWHNAGNFAAAIHDPDLQDGRDTARMKVIKREATFTDKMDVTYKRKVWIEVRNVSGECLEVSHPSWKASCPGINAKVHSGRIQVRIASTWCPEMIGAERIHLAPSERCRVWIEPDEQYEMEYLKQHCESELPMGTLRFVVDGVDVDVPV